MFTKAVLQKLRRVRKENGEIFAVYPFVELHDDVYGTYSYEFIIDGQELTQVLLEPDKTKQAELFIAIVKPKIKTMYTMWMNQVEPKIEDNLSSLQVLETFGVNDITLL